MPYRHIIICRESAPGNPVKKSCKKNKKENETTRKIIVDIFKLDQVHEDEWR